MPIILTRLLSAPLLNVIDLRPASPDGSALLGRRRECELLVEAVDRVTVGSGVVLLQAWVHAHPGPPAYGPPPPPPPSLSRAPAPLRTVNKALSWYVDQTHALTGTIVRDRRTGCLHTIRPGDVVVCTTTSPVWSVLFPSIGALGTSNCYAAGMGAPASTGERRAHR